MKASHGRRCDASWFDKLTMKRSFRKDLHGVEMTSIILGQALMRRTLLR